MADIAITINIDDATIDQRLREWGYEVRGGRVWYQHNEMGDIRTAFAGILHAQMWLMAYGMIDPCLGDVKVAPVTSH